MCDTNPPLLARHFRPFALNISSNTKASKEHHQRFTILGDLPLVISTSCSATLSGASYLQATVRHTHIDFLSQVLQPLVIRTSCSTCVLFILSPTAGIVF